MDPKNFRRFDSEPRRADRLSPRRDPDDPVGGLAACRIGLSDTRELTTALVEQCQINEQYQGIQTGEGGNERGTRKARNLVDASDSGGEIPPCDFRASPALFLADYLSSTRNESLEESLLYLNGPYPEFPLPRLSEDSDLRLGLYWAPSGRYESFPIRPDAVRLSRSLD